MIPPIFSKKNLPKSFSTLNTLEYKLSESTEIADPDQAAKNMWIRIHPCRFSKQLDISDCSPTYLLGVPDKQIFTGDSKACVEILTKKKS